MPGPKHRRAQSFIRQRFFDGISSFSELETRISALDTSRERGDAFEVFAEAYLATQQIVQLEEIWPFDAIPLSIKKDFGLNTGIDMGVDGMFQGPIGQTSAYQAKFRSGRPSLTWGELSTFMGLTDQVSQRVLFTNCDDLPPVINERTGFYCIRGNDLDRLQSRDFEAILSWLNGKVVPQKRKDPLPHQEKALENILAALQEEDRATVLMACGTGKTLVELWTAELMGCTDILVLVPSLALLRQTLHEWLKETSWEKMSYLCVCSDPTVEKGTDELVIRQSDLDFPVSTDSETVSNFLSMKSDGVKVIFSTYQSSRDVAEGMDKTYRFQLGIFDEAHKTSGREGARFSFALSDENLPISKRLFLTATPRHYDVQKKDKEGDSKLVYSMDVPEVYGDIRHKLPFSEAVREGIICDYRVIVSVVTSDMVNDELLRRGGVIVDGSPVKARQVANQIALKEAVEKHGMSKIFTFHRSVAAAKSFTSSRSEGIQVHLPDFNTYHVNGTMPTAKRERFMHEFRRADRSIMSNARCLTEGVDVPAVDMVGFMAPKRSRVDIVQATGRAMRKEQGKTVGFVLLPLFVEQASGESVEEAVQRVEFDEVWNILQAMQEQDDVLADVIRKMRKEKGRTGGYDESRFREKVEFLGAGLTLDALREAITIRCIERLGSSWDEWYGQLSHYRDLHGDCNVPRGWSGNPKLSKWVDRQRVWHKRGKLSEERICLLNEINFVWEPRHESWEEMFARLMEFREIQGHCNVPAHCEEDPGLSSWVGTQRRLRKRGQLSKSRIQRLDEIQFVWEPRKDDWEDMFNALVQYKNTKGDCNVPINYSKNRELGKWVFTQRRRLKEDKMEQWRIQRLNEIDFVWDILEDSWEKMFAELARYRAVNGHCNVPQRWAENMKLSSWVNKQRTLGKWGKMDEERLQRLDEIDFVWNVLEYSWNEMFTSLARYKEVNGHFNVPQRWRENPKLGPWIKKQRTLRRRGALGQERTKRLDEIGFPWDPQEAKWEERLSELMEYKNIHEHCNVPARWEGNPELGRWVERQRTDYRNGRLSIRRTAKLDDLGFAWDPYKVAWERMFNELEENRRSSGHCNVPQGYSENPRLARWVHKQRQRWSKGDLTEDHIHRLEEIGFQWQIRGRGLVS